MNELSIACVLYQCKKIDLRSLEQLAALVMRSKFEFQKMSGDKMARVRHESELKGLVELHFTRESASVCDVSFPAYPAVCSDLIGHFEFIQFSTTSNRLQLSSLFDFGRPAQLECLPSYEASVLTIAEAWNGAAKPDYGWIDNDSRNNTEPEDAEKLRMPVIGWVNVWGPAYVEKYGKRVLLGMPGEFVRELPGGAIFHRLSPRIVTSDKKAAAELRKRVVEYCAKHRLKVKCFAPYVGEP